MKRFSWIVVLVTGMFLLSSGLALALPAPSGYDAVEDRFEFLNGDGTLGAVLWAHYDGVDSITYVVDYEAFNPDSAPGDPGDGLDFLVSVEIPYLAPITDYIFDWTGRTFSPSTPSAILPDLVPGTVTFLFSPLFPGVADRSPEFIVTTLNPDHIGMMLSDVTVHDSSEEITEESRTLTKVLGGGGGNGVPEPSTLILLGGGILGLAVLRRRGFNRE